MNDERWWRYPDPILMIREGSDVLAEPTVVEPFGAEVWKQLGLRVTRSLGGPTDGWRVTADRYVGLARLPAHDGYAPQLQVTPKLPVDIFFLADYAFGAERDLLRDARLRADLTAIREDPAACLLAWFLAELESFVIRHLRRDYVLQREVFDGRVRGRLLLAEYVQRYRGSGQAQRAPCQFFEFTRDNLPNQILRRTLRDVASLATLVPLPEARRTLRLRIDRIAPFLGGVTDRPIHRADFNRLRLRAALRHYSPIIAKCRAILEGLYLATETGVHRQDAFLWEMSILFEKALGGILSTTPGIALEARRARARVVDSSDATVYTSKVKPDYILRGSQGRVLLDAKYKQTGAVGVSAAPEDEIDVVVEGAGKIRIGRADIYQAISYAQHDRYRPAETALIFPVALGAGQELPPPYRVEGFSTVVRFLFLDVGHHAASNLEAFRETLAGMFAPELELLVG